VAYSVRWGLVVVLAWIGGMKFTAYEAMGIQPLLKDIVLFGAAVWSLGESLKAIVA
jgi:uncharacterized membrane protein YkgB